MFERGSERIVQSSLALGSYSGQRNFQLGYLICERCVVGKTERNSFVEVDDEYLVLRVAGAGKRQCSGNHVSALRPHASTVIDNQPDCDWDIFVAEILDRLKHSVFIDVEIIFVESKQGRVCDPGPLRARS